MHSHLGHRVVEVGDLAVVVVAAAAVVDQPVAE
jgi:hypothetical protein